MCYSIELQTDNNFLIELQTDNNFTIELEPTSFTIQSITKVVNGEWGKITGNILDQPDLKDALNTIDVRLDTLESKSTSSVLTFPNFLFFPNIGQDDILYLDDENNMSYRWDAVDSKYYKINDYEEIIEINGGSANGK